MNMITLSQNESNLLYWCKHWYGPQMSQNFWQELKILCDEYFLMDCNIADMYEAVRQLWKKIIDVLPNKDHFWDEYERNTLPNKARYYFGAPNFANRDWHCNDYFNAEQMTRARVAVMVSQLATTKVEYYHSMLPQDVGDLKVVNREKLEKLFAEKLDGPK